MEMNKEMEAKLRRSLDLHERFSKYPYIDTKNNITIGRGYNLTSRGLPEDFLNQLYDEDVAYFYEQLNKTFPWFSRLNQDRQIILIDMCFMGFKKFCGFKKMISALAREDYREAAREMLDSQWAKEVGKRAVTLANAMQLGVYEIKGA